MGEKRTHLLTSSSLVEVVVSLVIITFIIAMATRTFVQLIGAAPGPAIHTMKQLEEIASTSIRKNDFDQQFFILQDGTKAFQTIKTYRENPLLRVYELQTEPGNDKKVVAFRKILLTAHE